MPACRASRRRAPCLGRPTRAASRSRRPRASVRRGTGCSHRCCRRSTAASCAHRRRRGSSPTTASRPRGCRARTVRPRLRCGSRCMRWRGSVRPLRRSARSRAARRRPTTTIPLRARRGCRPLRAQGRRTRRRAWTGAAGAGGGRGGSWAGLVLRMNSHYRFRGKKGCAAASRPRDEDVVTGLGRRENLARPIPEVR